MTQFLFIGLFFISSLTLNKFDLQVLGKNNWRRLRSNPQPLGQGATGRPQLLLSGSQPWIIAAPQQNNFLRNSHSKQTKEDNDFDLQGIALASWESNQINHHWMVTELCWGTFCQEFLIITRERWNNVGHLEDSSKQAPGSLNWP